MNKVENPGMKDKEKDKDKNKNIRDMLYSLD